MIIRTKMFGLPVIIRHDYKGKQLQKIHKYVEKSVAFFLRYCKKYKVETIIDIGAGDGYAGDLFIKEKYKVVSIDLYPGSPKVKKWNFYELEKLKRKFDAVFCNHTLEHADSPYRLMEQIDKITHKGSILFIAVPDGSTKWAWDLKSSTTHFSCLTKPFLKTMVSRFGFQVKLIAKEFRKGAKEIWLIGVKK